MMGSDKFHLIFALAVFFVAYIWLMTEKTPRHVVVLYASAALLLGQVLTLQQAFDLVNWNTLASLLGMFILVEALSNFGFFNRLATTLIRRLKDRRQALFFVLCAAAGLLSMVINNITVMLFLTNLTLQICRGVPLEPIPLIIGEVSCANMVGAATLIGSPPNLVMAGILGYGFSHVAIHMAPLMIISTAVFMTVYYVQNVDSLYHSAPLLAGMTLKVGLERMTAWRLFLKIDFETLLFFMGLFILVGALDHVGLFQILAQRLATVQNPLMLMLATLWLSAMASALVDNIPMALAMAYLIKKLAAMSPGFPSEILVWAALIGLTLGGNMTPIGASPNVVAYGLLEKHRIKIGWKKWGELTIPATLCALLAASALVWIKYRIGWY